MTRRQILTSAAVVAAGVLVTDGLMLAQRGPDGDGRGGRGHRFGHRMDGGRMFEALNLTQQQREQVQAVFEQHRTELQAAGEKLFAARRAQREAVTAAPLDEAQVRARAADSAAAEADMAVLRAKIRSEVVQILTPDQQTKLQEMEANRRNRVGDWMQRRRERRQPAQPPAL